MPKTAVEVDLEAPTDEQPQPLHNRWHPDIPAVTSVEPGEKFRVECIDWTGGQVENTDTANDIRDMDLDRNHHLSGPIHVEGAQPGDLIAVDILDIGTIQGHEWGYNGIFAQDNGGGLLTDHYPNACKSVWSLDGVYATSRHIPDVRFEGMIHPGLIGTAPSQELLDRWNARERALADTDSAEVPNHPTGGDVPPNALPPNENEALVGDLDGADAERVATEGARTVPPRENGGNCDIKDLSLGSRVYFPVYVEGANLSMGDIHFSQGDGEITFCGAIEMPGYLDLEAAVIDDGMDRLGVDHPIFEPGHMGPNYSDYLVFEGYSVDDEGTQHYLDAHVAHRQACLDAIEYLKGFGYTGEQAYMILGTAPIESRIAGIVDIPNTCVTVSIPKAIFEFDIDPTGLGSYDEASRGDVARTD
jgi:formamidase